MATNQTTKIFLLDVLATTDENDPLWQEIEKTYKRHQQVVEITAKKDIERAAREIAVPLVSGVGIYARFIAPSVLAAFVKFGEVCKPSKCGCGSTVRLVLNNDKMCAMCPVCGQEYPYAFYDLKVAREFTFVNADSLVLHLADDFCDDCGESKGKPPCRCQRKRVAELNEKIAAEYGTIDSHSDQNTHSQVMERIKPLREELDQLNAACGK